MSARQGTGSIIGSISFITGEPDPEPAVGRGEHWPAVFSLVDGKLLTEGGYLDEQVDTIGGGKAERGNQGADQGEHGASLASD